MVLGLHANFIALGNPEAESILTVDGISRTFMQSCCVVAVNVFVMISGWFGIKSTLRGFCNFMWQVIYVVCLLWIVGIMFFNQPVSLKSLFGICGLYGGGGWFVASYIGLYIIAPVLNAYVEKTAPRNIVLMLVAFFAFEFLWGNTLSVEFVVGGYSTFSFIGIYVLAGLLRKVHLRYNSAWPYVTVYLTATVLNTLLYVCAVRIGSIAIRDMLFNYVNPLVIIASASLLIAFAKVKTSTSPHSQMPIYQRIVLSMAASCFAAYLLHVGAKYTSSIYCEGARNIYNTYSGFTTFVVMVGYILAVFMLAVLIDQPRKLIWEKILLPLFAKHD